MHRNNESAANILLIVLTYSVISTVTGCLIANINTSTCSGGEKNANQIWLEDVLGIMNSGILTYDPSIWLKVKSLSTKRKGEKNQ